MKKLLIIFLFIPTLIWGQDKVLILRTGTPTAADSVGIGTWTGKYASPYWVYTNYAPISHTQAWSTITSVPATFTPSTITVTGDVTGSGGNSMTLTLATVSTAMSGVNSITVNAKGLVTSATTVAGAGGIPADSLAFKKGTSTVYLRDVNDNLSLGGTVAINKLDVRGGANVYTNQDSLKFWVDKTATDMDGDSGITVLPNGNVGIGTTNPGYPLEVTGSAKVSTYIGVGVNPNTGYSITTGVNGMTIGSGGTLDFGGGNSRIIDGGGSYCMTFLTWNGSNITEKMRITGTGNIGINTTAPSSRFSITGASRQTDTLMVGTEAANSHIHPGDANWTVVSDSTLKKNITLFTTDLTKFKSVKPKSYQFKKEIFLEKFDTKLLTDTLKLLAQGGTFSGTTAKLKNENIKIKVKNDSIQTAFNLKNNENANRMSSKVHKGFMAQDFNKQLLNSDKLDIDYSEVLLTMWLKIQELEERIILLEAGKIDKPK